MGAAARRFTWITFAKMWNLDSGRSRHRHISSDSNNRRDCFFDAVGNVIDLCSICMFIDNEFVWKSNFSIKPLAQNKEAERKINQLLGGFDPSFSYPYFISQLISTLKIITFTKDRTNLPQYTGSNPHTDLDNIIEMAFNGVLKLNHYTVQNGYCTLNLEMGMDVVREDGNKIKTKAELYRMTIVKNVAKLEDIHFSVKRVECKKCGGSFDAMKEKVCPYCGENYDYKEDDWMVLQLETL